MTLGKEMKTFTITATALALLSGILAQGSFGHAIVVISAFLFIGVPLALFLALWLVIGLKRSGGMPTGWRKTSTISAVIGGSLILSFGTGSLIHHWQIRKVRDFVAATVPSLDEYRSKNGTHSRQVKAMMPDSIGDFRVRLSRLMWRSSGSNSASWENSRTFTNWLPSMS